MIHRTWNPDDGNERNGRGNPAPLADLRRGGLLSRPPSSHFRWDRATVRMSNDAIEPGSFGSAYHAPVMVREVLHYLEPARGGVFVDGTLGGGGHTEALLRSGEQVRVIAADRDPEARAEAAQRLAGLSDRLTIFAGNFADVANAPGLPDSGVGGILLDLGISSHQIDEDARGFTFRTGVPLDMRMEGEGGGETAAEILNNRSETELADIFYRWGEEKRSRRLARAVVERREMEPIQRSDELVELISQSLPGAGNQDHARIFQALRIAVNEEMDALGQALPRLREMLAPGGVMVIIAYHSIEDRMVKDAFREWSRDCICPPGLPICACRGHALGTTLTRKPIGPAEEEVRINPRSRSARLRAWKKL